MIRKKRIGFVLSLIALLAMSCQQHESTKVADNSIWFDQATQQWNEGLPIGNGSLGAMLYGNPQKELITLNEETIWSGKKRYDADKPQGHLYIGKVQQLIFDHEFVKAEELLYDKVMGERLPSGKHSFQLLGRLFVENLAVDDYTDYERRLDMNRSVASTKYVSDGVKYRTEAFSSYPDQVMVMKYSADKPQGLNLAFSVKRTDETAITVSENCIVFSEHVGKGYGVKLHSILDFELKGGKSYEKDGKLVVEGAEELIVRIVAASDYRGDDPEYLCEDMLKHAKQCSYALLLQNHISDYKSLYDRVDFKISEVIEDTIPTDIRLKNIKQGTADDYLTQLQYNYGRYLLISSSRPGTLPANLQGIWVNGLKAPWNSDYHININMQMNYWPAEMTNLSECHEPMLEFVGNLREMGRLTAQKTYGCNGFVAHHTSDVWYPTNTFGKANYGMWPMGAAWCCQHLYTHYEYTLDREYLRDYAYPVMKEAAVFFVDFMVKHPVHGYLVSGPSISPENRYITKDGKDATINMGPTMDRAIIFELFSNCIASAETLGTDEEFVKVLKAKMAAMPPLQIGSDGRLMEWTEEFEEHQPGHRHISHLYALHPSNQISQAKTPELFDAARKTIDYRLSHGGGHTGWSRAWIINFWARLLDGEEAYKNIVALQQKSTLPNLLDLHPPFQIDGNFGVVSGITEMLMQSHTGEINLLPALPSQWENGEIKGIVARGGFELDVTWEKGQLKHVKVTSRLGQDLVLRYGHQLLECPTEAGQVLDFDSALKEI